MNRRKSRESAMRILYQMPINETECDEVIKNYIDNIEADVSEIDIQYVNKVVKGVLENVEELDSKIESKLVKWKLNRISKTNLSILRLALYEMIHENEIPERVSVNEAVELAKKYSEDKSPKFINGILGNFVVNEEKK